MKTVIYQSYRTFDVSPWLTTCMESVKNWAALRGYDYRFYDDRFFEYAPEWYRARLSGRKVPISDYCRLAVAKELLSDTEAGGFERAVWVDADVLVFDPENFVIKTETEFAFCYEVWIASQNITSPGSVSRRFNNAVSVYVKGNSLLDFYMYACRRRVESAGDRMANTDMGTAFLTGLHGAVGFEQLRDVALVGPIVLSNIAAGGGPHLTMYLNAFNHSAHAINLCASYRNAGQEGLIATDAMYEAAIAQLLKNPGLMRVPRPVPTSMPASTPPR